MTGYRIHTAQFYSKHLNGRRVYRIAIPEKRSDESKPLPLLVLLHGVHGSETDWTEQGNLLETLQEQSRSGNIGDMAVLMPSDGLFSYGTGYLDWAEGYPHLYERYLLEEALLDAEQRFDVGGIRSRRSIAGLSMGGYASVRLGWTWPEQFSSVSSLSGFFDAHELEVLIGGPSFASIFQGDQARIHAASPLTMPLPSEEQMPKLYWDCGIDDPYINYNRQLCDRLRGLAISHRYEEEAGAHTWDYWRKRIRHHLQFHYHVMKEATTSEVIL
ncbi:alpha/beta hydrolase-fold protein [Paenibacillus sp. RC67]|uniref:alpha/beta hydrolase n=1 Tax=Paenibacillus sp. RC67 TaxID=3039392 RepID=UPI0024AE5B0C|nr:alpha/beta hydrolase-fold protein [Paenibacillus sp. RC67]